MTAALGRHRAPAPEGGPPNNSLSEFGGAAWQYEEATGQYYYHAFLAAQPDLNWRNPQVREAIYDVMRFWLRKGADGFRVDVIWHLMNSAITRRIRISWKAGRRTRKSIGIRQVSIAPDQVRDPFEKNVPGIGVGRDGCRTPMQWNATLGCGLFNGYTVAAAGR